MCESHGILVLSLYFLHLAPLVLLHPSPSLLVLLLLHLAPAAAQRKAGE